jgi:hypothetical protein
MEKLLIEKKGNMILNKIYFEFILYFGIKVNNYQPFKNIFL